MNVKQVTKDMVDDILAMLNCSHDDMKAMSLASSSKCAFIKHLQEGTACTCGSLGWIGGSMDGDIISRGGACVLYRLNNIYTGSALGSRYLVVDADKLQSQQVVGEL